MTSRIKASGMLGLLCMTIALAAMPVAVAAAPSPSARDLACQAAVAQTYATMDSATAIKNAQSSSYYERGIASYSGPTFNSIFEIATTITPYPTCAEHVQSFNVVFALHNSTGAWEAYLVIAETQNLVVTGSGLQTQSVVSTNHYENWGGYEAAGNSGATQTVYESYTDFTQPTPSYPTSGGCGTAGTCNVGTWTGLEDALGAPNNNHLDQDGTGAWCTVTGTSCSTTGYVAWYESLPAAQVQCNNGNGGSVAVHGGDTIYSEVVNEAKNGGHNYNYDFDITDSTDSPNQTCYAALSDTSMTAPTYAAFITENEKASANGGYEPLTGFGTAPFTGATIYTGGSFSTINNFPTVSSNMENQAGISPLCYGSFTTNVSYGTLSSSGSFTMTYNSNQYTPSYQTGC